MYTLSLLLYGMHPTRESWLNHVAASMAPMFAALNAPLPPKIRIAIGFTSTGRRGKRIGECWDSTCSADGTFEILIRPDLVEAKNIYAGRVADILAHELVHAAVGIAAGHGPLFKRVALAIGLEGKMRATTAGPKFKAAIKPILADAGPLPHGRLTTDRGKTTAPKKQTLRHIACVCDSCGYAVRTTRKWLELKGAPHCPEHGPMTPAS